MWGIKVGGRKDREKEKKASAERKGKRYRKGSIFIKDCEERNSQVGAEILIIEVKGRKKGNISCLYLTL